MTTQTPQTVNPAKGDPCVRWSDPFERLEVGQRFQSSERIVRETDVLLFCALTGDWHPQHCDRRWAEASPFGQRIAHGMLVLSLAVGLVPLDPRRVIALRRVSDVVFKRPVRLEDTIFVEGGVKGLMAIDKSSGLVDFDWRIRGPEQALIARARVQVVWRRGPALAEHGGGGFWHEEIDREAAPGAFVPVPL